MSNKCSGVTGQWRGLVVFTLDCGVEGLRFNSRLGPKFFQDIFSEEEDIYATVDSGKEKKDARWRRAIR